MKSIHFKSTSFALIAIAFIASTRNSSAQETPWHDGRFHVDTAGLLGRSDIVLAHPNFESTQAMPLGNGSLGVAVWSADGFEAISIALTTYTRK